ncbi:Lin0512 family protein [Thalassospiraceae bacterium LMO-SO8]|nr:Lin0512 family protein [Alphaproteobacteria bacterium LMO-S08]WND75810.1 Lin0512 family protein [Thalassospiraceae bacterium LMO-SO8]
MSKKLDRVILEMGSGVSLRGGNYTKAACRAVDDAIHHSSLSVMRELGMDPDADMTVEVTIGVQDPSAVDVDAVQAMLPHGKATVRVVKGGLNVPYPERGYETVIASAAVAAFADLSRFKASK